MSELKALRDRTATRLAGIIELRRKNDVIKSVVLPTEIRDLPAVLVTARRVMRRADGGANIGSPSFICDGTIIVVVRSSAATEEYLEDILLDQAEVVTDGLLNDADWMHEIESIQSIETDIRTTSEGEVLMGDAVLMLTARWREDFGAVATHALREVHGKLPTDNPDDDDAGFGVDDLPQT